MAQADGDAPASNQTRQHLRDLHRELIRLHTALLHTERDEYERVNGLVSSGQQMFQLVLNDEHFAWLRAISQLIVRIDEIMDARDPESTEEEAQAALELARQLLRPSEEGDDFQRKYFAALQRDSASILAHRQVTLVLKR